MIIATLKDILGLGNRGARLTSAEYVPVQGATGGVQRVAANLLVPNGAIGTSQIATGAVGSDQLAAAAVLANKLGVNATGDVFVGQASAGSAGSIGSSMSNQASVSVTITSAQAPANVVLIGTVSMSTTTDGGQQYGQCRTTWNGSQVGVSQFTHFTSGATPTFSGGGAVAMGIAAGVSAGTYTAALQASCVAAASSGTRQGAAILAVVLARQ